MAMIVSEYLKFCLNAEERTVLQSSFDGLSFSCGAQLQDANIPDKFMDVVYVRQLKCFEPVEK